LTWRSCLPGAHGDRERRAKSSDRNTPSRHGM
jgi:hypothetical protein